MALVTAFLYLSGVLVIAAVAIALGIRILQGACLSPNLSALEEPLYAAGVSFAILGVVAFALETMGWLRQSTALGLFVFAALAAGGGWRRLTALLILIPRVLKKIAGSGVALILTAAIIGCAVLDCLLAMAPLTGSDALVYHFTLPKLRLTEGPAPTYWLTKGFWAGQGHALIALGMALGSDRVSMGLILLGGLFTAVALFVLARHLTSERWAGIATLLFLLTPMVFWQMGTSGSPDIWMAFFTTLAVMAVARGARSADNRWLVLGGVFAGAAAGVKFTGWAVPVGIVTYCLFATGSLYRTAACGLSSLPAGVLPLVRNTWWTGDPLFPFLTRWLRPGHLNTYTLAAILADTHPAGFHRSVSGLLTFPLLLTIKGDAYGVGQYFGPVVLTLSPLLVFAFRKKREAHAAAIVWGVVFLLVDLTSQMARFLLPVFPLAIALTFVGVAEAFRRRWRVIQVACAGALLLTITFGLGSETLYARDFLPVALGLENREAFLGRMAPDYLVSSFVNRSLEGRGGKAMVFFQHVYYLRVPFLIGDPQVSWVMNPARLNGPQSLMDLFQQQNVQWVIKAPGYPEPFASSFKVLEEEGKLRPLCAADVSTYSSFRIYGERVPVHVMVMEVVPAP